MASTIDTMFAIKCLNQFEINFLMTFFLTDYFQH